MDIIDVAYPNKDKTTLRAYKDFFIDIRQNIRKSFTGKYIPETHSLVICNIYRTPKHSIITALHELSHHIETIDKGESLRHSKYFYSVFEKLIGSALDMGVIDKVDITSITDTSDGKKLNKFLETYKYNPVKYNKDYQYIIIYNGYKIRNELKNKGYFFSSFDKTWIKRFINKDIKEEKEKLLKLKDDLEIEIRKPNDIYINSVGYIVISGNTFKYKDILKENGFYYKNQKWAKKVTSNDTEEELKKIRMAKFIGCNSNFQYEPI